MNYLLTYTYNILVIILNSITVDDLRNLNGVNIIDIRSEEKYNDNHILDAYNIPYNKLLISPNNYLDKNKIYYVYCQKGVTSSKLCSLLNSKGYNLINIIGGYEAWILTE